MEFRPCLSFLLLLATPFFAAKALAEGAAANAIEVRPSAEISRLLREADTDHDQKITVRDRNATFWLEDVDHRKYEVSGHYYLSNLLQELKLASDEKPATASKQLKQERIFENPVSRISRSIRELYWEGLTRQIDADHLAQVLPDDKIPQEKFRYLYVPAKDEEAFAYFSQAAKAHPEFRLQVQRLPEVLDPTALKEIGAHPGVLSLALLKTPDGRIKAGAPFVVPGGRFNEMYGWDSYFESLGLLEDGRVDLARSMVDNFVYEIENYGKILNANRSYYLTRSQPPFLTSMILAVYAKLEKTPDTRAWLERSVRAAIKEYNQVWMNPERLTDTGLSRYFGSGRGIPPEVEKGHFDFILKPAATRHHLTMEELVRRYNAGEVQDEAFDEFFSQDRAVRESGHDTTYRWRVDGVDRAADFVTVDLNSLLYKTELDLARVVRTELSDNFDGTTSAQWLEKARLRKDRMLKYLWDPGRKIFFDYNFKNKKRSTYVSATGFYPLWATDVNDNSTRILTNDEGIASLHALLKELEQPGGISATSRTSLVLNGDANHPRQWEFPNGWAPHQILAWGALKNYAQTTDLNRLVYKWLYSITKNAADYNGTVPEKMDVVKRSHEVFAEYGNVGTRFSYITKEGFGWMNASYQIGLKTLAPEWRSDLEALRPPEWVNFSKH